MRARRLIRADHSGGRSSVEAIWTSKHGRHLARAGMLRTCHGGAVPKLDGAARRVNGGARARVRG
ncbi:MAG: hypothetical protein B7Z33_11120 [Sphingomonadales bacterium 12-68-11]|nr:MAG: hypothetical protein B7Z33_11120 [Sphingomonadales bacterium 12-68-11]